MKKEKAKRNACDFYPTPMEVVTNFITNYGILEGNILEPSAGNGNIVNVIKNKNNNITALELREEETINLSALADHVVIGDFLKYEPTQEYDYIITNPPFSMAQEFIEHCFKIKGENTKIIMLLRLSFLESQRRYAFWKTHPVNKLYVLSKRPSFTGKGTDSAAYAWFVWDNSKTQEIHVI